MIIDNVELEMTAGRPDQFPRDGLPEIVFAGKSNVGKSSLLNVLIGRRALARTSGKPGKTQTINFYNVESKALFVDLPGYGYAKASKARRDEWSALTADYLETREQITKVILLIDLRHKPSQNDIMMYEWIHYYHEQVIVIATKADKVRISHMDRHINQVIDGLDMEEGDVLIPFSAKIKQGRKEIWDVIQE